MRTPTPATSSAVLTDARPDALAAIPAQRTLRDRSARYDRQIAEAADDIACAVSAAHRLPVAFAERKARDESTPDTHGRGARHRQPGPPCDRLERTRPAGRPAGGSGPAR